MSRTAILLAAVLSAVLTLPSELTARGVVINEIHYEPDDKRIPEEFIELYNAGRSEVDLSGWFFSEGIDYTFPHGTVLGPDEYIVIAEDPATVANVFGYEAALGPYAGRLENDGERVVLRAAGGAIVDEVDYRARFPWPIEPAGRGSSLELLDPALDNDLGGSWRPSGFVVNQPPERSFLLHAEAEDWAYRPATSEPSDPPEAWRDPDFALDASWRTGQTSIGFGDDDDKTVLDDMRGNYSGVYIRREFTLDEVSRFLVLRLYVDDGAIVWINGAEVLRFNVRDGEQTFDATAARGHEARWEEHILSGTDRYLRRGRNVIAIHAMNLTVTSNDASIDVELAVPSQDDLGGISSPPTPGRANTVLAENAPPQIRQVEHSPQQPSTEDPIVVTAKVTDPDGVSAVWLDEQTVAPGDYIPAFLPLAQNFLLSRPTDPRPPNPEFEDPANWTRVIMLDDGEGDDLAAGDGTFTATLSARPNRTLVRYRIAARDTLASEVRVPYVDDRTLNFACFVYDGVPAYEATRLSVAPDGPGHVYDAELMSSLPVYFLLTRAADMTHCLGYSSGNQIPKSNERARDRFNWEGAFVYDGKVYDHVFYRLRQANDRYGGGGKRSMRIRFHKGSYLEARDNYGQRYPTRWRTLNTGKMFDNKRVGNFGLTETMNADLWNMVGVPAPWFHTFHFRVIDGQDEVPEGALGQYLGDFWGMFNAIEDYDPRFLEAHGMEDGNLYKLKDGIFNGADLLRNQGRFAITPDADFQNIRQNLRPQRTDEWLDAHVNYDRWYPYHAVVEGIRHYDFRPANSHSKNRAWYFEPDYSGSEFGRLWTLPWDSDASWGPNWNSGEDYSKNTIFAGRKETYKRRYRNFIREFRDLLWVEETINQMIDDLAAFVIDFSKADRDRWRSAPAAAGSQDFGAIESKIADMKRFAFVGWSGSTGPTVPAGGRARHLENLANAEGAAARIPTTPSVTPTAPEGFSKDALTFESSAFSDPQGDETFSAMKWRVGEVSDPDAPGYDPTMRRVHEWTAIWESPELEVFTPSIRIPGNTIRTGHRYRVRVRMRDDEMRWSHWSDPVEFVAGARSVPAPQEGGLRVTEIMFNPPGGSDYEFIELQNIGGDTIDMREVRFTNGVRFDFAGSAIESLGPGEFAVIVRNRRVFELRYGRDTVPIAGEYSGRLDNDGDRIGLTFGAVDTIQDFRYDDGWYPTPDGIGHSLVIRDADDETRLWDFAEGWRPSWYEGGSPGVEDDRDAALQLPGDATQDGRLNVSDAVEILRVLFRAGEVTLPCGDGSLTAAGNRSLLDINADRGVNLTDAVALLEHLFRAGPPPALGTRCTPMEDCPPACGGGA